MPAAVYSEGMGADERARMLREAVRAIASRCPRLIGECYWAGTSAISLLTRALIPRMRSQCATNCFAC